MSLIDKLWFYRRFLYVAIAARFNKVILITGLPRSGSTMVFNTVRILAGSSSIPFESYWINDFKWRRQYKKVIILKIHHYDPLIARIKSTKIHSTRNLLEVASSITLKDELPTIKFMERIAFDNQHWLPLADLVLDHKKISNAAIDCVSEIAALMNLQIENHEDIVTQLGKIRNQSFTKVDKETQMHPNHVTRAGKAWENVLPEGFIEQIKHLVSD